MKRLKIGISGGGLGGFAAAVALARDGHEVTIFEASAVLQEVRSCHRLLQLLKC